MKVTELFEDKEKSEAHLLPIDQIAQLLFKKRAGIVKDPKRDKDKTFLGVSHEKSTVKGALDKHLFLTFDNSTDSGEFELNSLTPLKIVKGDDTDRAIKKLFVKHELDVKTGMGYVVKGDATYLRELRLGKKLGKQAVHLVGDFIKVIKKLEAPEPDEAEAKSDTEE